jgi:hypothetical protein
MKPIDPNYFTTRPILKQCGEEFVFIIESVHAVEAMVYAEIKRLDTVKLLFNSSQPVSNQPWEIIYVGFREYPYDVLWRSPLWINSLSN